MTTNCFLMIGNRTVTNPRDMYKSDMMQMVHICEEKVRGRKRKWIKGIIILQEIDISLRASETQH